MTGPYPPNPGGYPPAPMMAYPEPPAVSRPPRPRRGLIAGLVLAAVALAALAGLIGYTVHGNGSHQAGGAGGITESSAKTAIQDYLNALLDRDIDRIARNTLCGIYDAVRDHRPDDAVAKVSSDAFRRQFAQAEVASIDKIVYLSDAQAQALFTIRVTRLSGDQRDDRTQGVAQLLSVDDSVLVCSYQLRSTGTL